MVWCGVVWFGAVSLGSIGSSKYQIAGLFGHPKEGGYENVGLSAT